MSQTKEQFDAICWKLRHFYVDFLDQFNSRLDVTKDDRICADKKDYFEMAKFCQNDLRITDYKELEPLRPFLEDELFSVLFLYDFNELSKKNLSLNSKLENRAWITAASIPSFVKSISGWVFSGCHELLSIDIPDSVVYLDEYAFEGCTKLETVRLSDNLVSILTGTFHKCYNLKTIHFPDNLHEIKEAAFAFCHSLEEIRFPSSLESIGQEAFFGCFNLKNVILPASLTYVGDDAFSHCDNIEHYFYEGTKNEYHAIKIEDYFDPTIDYYKVYFYSETKPEEEGRFWHYVNNKPVVW